MPQLYRSARDPQHWFIFLEDRGWLKFPAKLQGWKERSPMLETQTLDLRPVPLRLSFNTGFLESVNNRKTKKAA
jgi:hypothetical protein